MHFRINYGREQVAFEVADARLVGDPWVLPPALLDPSEAVRAALEEPVDFPPLRRALTPDDHVAVVVDGALPHLAELIVPMLEHVLSAGVRPGAVTLLSPPSDSAHAWLNDLPEELEDVLHEVHNPSDRNKLAYLATTKRGRRLYLNRTAVDADQVVVLSGRRYDPLLGHAGAQAALFPAMSDQATRTEFGKQVHLPAPGHKPWPVEEEAQEAAWLLGVPFFVQIIAGAGDEITRVIAGSVEASKEAQRVQDGIWRRTVPAAAELVVAAVSGNPARHEFADLAAALACASRVVASEGRVVLLTQACPPLGPAGEALLQADSPREALKQLQKQANLELAPALQWAQAASRAHINLLSGLPVDTAEGLFTTPLDHAGQAQRLVDGAASCLFLPDANKSLALLPAARALATR
jgi:hypothetical protein